MLPQTRAIATPLPLLSLTASVAAAVLIHLAVASLHGVLRTLAAPGLEDPSWSPLAVEGHTPEGRRQNGPSGSRTTGWQRAQPSLHGPRCST